MKETSFAKAERLRQAMTRDNPHSTYLTLFFRVTPAHPRGMKGHMVVRLNPDPRPLDAYTIMATYFSEDT